LSRVPRDERPCIVPPEVRARKAALGIARMLAKVVREGPIEVSLQKATKGTKEIELFVGFVSFC